jgi:hypothetical protein
MENSVLIAVPTIEPGWNDVGPDCDAMYSAWIEDPIPEIISLFNNVPTVTGGVG